MQKWLKIMLLCVFGVLCGGSLQAQRIITYESGMGTRDPYDANVWILYQGVKAMHEGMVLYCDSATFDTKANTFFAFRSVRMVLSDTTTLYGDEANYNGTTRMAIVSADTVVLVDGETTLRSDCLQYDRNTSTASYFGWGHTTHGSSALDSRKGYYYRDTRDLFLIGEVVLSDSNSRLLTDTLRYNTRTELAEFVSPTRIYSDSGTVYSEQGSFHTGTHQAASYKASEVWNRAHRLTSDTLFYNDKTEVGEAFGHVCIADTANDVACYGHYGTTDQQRHVSWVTDSALVQLVDEGDSLFVHADTLWVFNDDDQQLERIVACRHVRFFRADVQGSCDSLGYVASDSLMTLHYEPVMWYEDYQLTADTIVAYMDSDGVRLMELRGNVFAIEQVDSLRFSQVKGRNANVYCRKSEPLYADILGSARMTYYVLDEERDGTQSILGVNAGVGSDMRIYFEERKPRRVVTYGSPDMKMYPLKQLPEDEKRLPGFKWLDSIRPHSRYEVFPPTPTPRDTMTGEPAPND